MKCKKKGTSLLMEKGNEMAKERRKWVKRGKRQDLGRQ